MSDKENEPSTEYIENPTPELNQSLNASQADETIREIREKQVVLDHAEDNAEKLTLEDRVGNSLPNGVEVSFVWNFIFGQNFDF